MDFPSLSLPLLFSTAGTGRTGFIPVPPNNYPFYNDDEKYVPIMQADGGQLSGNRASRRRTSLLLIFYLHNPYILFTLILKPQI